MDQRVLFSRLMTEFAAVGAADLESLELSALHAVEHLRGSLMARDKAEGEERLLQRWYSSLERGEPDWSVYADDYYLVECWVCWTVYSRKYLNAVSSSKSLVSKSILSDMTNVRRIVDLGCGIGLTSAALKQMIPEAEVVSTNFPSLKQTAVAERLGERFGFKVVGEVSEAESPADLIFASEYFEHVEAPVAHLRDVLARLRPRYMLIANTFGSQSIGHFDSYKENGGRMTGNQTSRRFNDCLRRWGYEKTETKLWNQRPAYWKKTR